MKRLLVLAAIIAAYMAGHWPERQARVASESDLQATHARLERAEARNRLYDLHALLIDLLATVEAKNFGEAQRKATAFFDVVRAEAQRPEQAQARKVLEEILAARDPLTIAMTQHDDAALEMLRVSMTRLRAALGHAPLQARPGPSPSP